MKDKKVIVSFDYGTAAETVAIFLSESMYMSCLSALEMKAAEAGAELIESIGEDDER